MSDVPKPPPDPKPADPPRPRRPTPPTKHTRGGPGHHLSESTPLSPREEAFVAEYTTTFHASEAARAVGYKGDARTISVTACNLVARPHIQAAIRRTIEARRAKLEATAERTIQETAWIAHADVGQLFDAKGNLRRIHELPAHVRAAIASVEVVKRNMTAGDGKVELVYKVKCWSKVAALELLAKHFGLIDGEPAQTVAPGPIFQLPDGCAGV